MILYNKSRQALIYSASRGTSANADNISDNIIINGLLDDGRQVVIIFRVRDHMQYRPYIQPRHSAPITFAIDGSYLKHNTAKHYRYMIQVA